jgi:hypothetical protein
MKNQSIKPIGKYEVGGTNDDECMEVYTDANGKPKRRRKKGCGYAASQMYNKKQQGKEKRKEIIGKVVAGVGAAGAATAAYLSNIFGVKDKVKAALNNNKVGGTVKKKSGGPVKRTRTAIKKK